MVSRRRSKTVSLLACISRWLMDETRSDYEIKRNITSAERQLRLAASSGRTDLAQEALKLLPSPKANSTPCRCSKCSEASTQPLVSAEQAVREPIALQHLNILIALTKSILHSTTTSRDVRQLKTLLRS